MNSLKLSCIFLFFSFLQIINGASMQRLSPEQHYSNFKAKAAVRTADFLQSCSGTQIPAREGRMFFPIGYGADPTGVEDSTDAIMKAVKDAFEVQKGVSMLQGINDLGGVVIHLQGGNYKISKPIVFPASGGNVVMQGGTLRASNSFPKNEFLIELRSPWSKIPAHAPFRSSSQARLTSDKKPNRLGVYYEDITFRDILFDANFTGGGLLVLDAVRTRIDNCFFSHFTTTGIFVSGGHETFISSSFLGQHFTIGGDPRERNFTGTAIDLASNDNGITDVVIFSAATGIVLRGQANMITGVHCYNKATYWGGVGIHVKLPGLSQTRIDDCYMDYNSIVMEDPVQVHVTNGFFLGNGNVVVKSVKGKISGLTIVDNMFAGSGGSVPNVKLEGKFSDVKQVAVDRNNVLEMKMVSTVAEVSVGGKGKKWVADFNSLLLFPNRINHMQYSFYVKGGSKIPVHAVTAVRNNTVVVEAAAEVDGVVSVRVDQNARFGESSPFMS